MSSITDTSTREFLATLFGEDDLPGSLVIASFGPNHIEKCSTIDTAVEAASRLSDQQREAYFGCALMDPSCDKRGTAADAVAIPGFWQDLDFGPGHKKNVPPDEASARALLEEMPLPPTMVVHSGGGLHAYWLFHELLQIDAANRDSVKATAVAWQSLIQAKAKARGWVLDSTADLARVLRPPGTLNYKEDNPRPVVVTEFNPDKWYSLEDFAAWVTVEPDPTPPPPDPDQPPAASNNGHADVDEMLEAFRSVADREFVALFDRGDITGQPSGSEADLRLCGILYRAGFNTLDLLDQAFRRSKLYDDKWDARPDYRQSTFEKAAAGLDKAKAEADPPIAIPITDQVALAAGPAHVTPRRTTITIKVLVDGQGADTFPVNDSLTSRSQAERAIARYTGPGHGPAIGIAIGKLFAQAQQQMEEDAAAQFDGKTIAEMLAENVPDQYDLSFKTDRGVWSEGEKREITRSMFVSDIPEQLVALCASAADAPRDRDGRILRPRLIHSMEVELKVIWSTITKRLPKQETDNTKLDHTSEAAQVFASKVIEIFTSGLTFERTKIEDSEIGRRATLASRILYQMKFNPENGRGQWTVAQPNFDCWWRWENESENLVLIAFRHSLAKTMSCPIPRVRSQTGLTTLAKRYGVARDLNEAEFVTRLTNGTHVTILSAEITAEILAQPMRKLQSADDIIIDNT